MADHWQLAHDLRPIITQSKLFDLVYYFREHLDNRSVLSFIQTEPTWDNLMFDASVYKANIQVTIMIIKIYNIKPH